MWQRKRLLYLLLAGGGTTMLLTGLSLTTNCADYLTGQLEEPQGPIEVTKLTLFDSTSRDAPVFTDTSIPNCDQNQTIDCTDPDNRDTLVCRVCYNDVAKDKYTPSKSVPTPDSGSDMRVVFNKVPLLLAGNDISTPDNLNKALTLNCPTCMGIPPLNHVLQISGSDVSFDPTQVPYGPSLQLTVATTDPRSALEPDSAYTVTVNPGVAGRDGNAVDTAIPPALLSFQTEPFKILRLGSGDSKKDTWVYNSTAIGDGSATKPFTLADLPQNATVAVRFNASLATSLLKGVKLTALINSGAAQVDVELGANNCKLAKGAYVQDDGRTLYLIPKTVDRAWPTIANELTVVIPAQYIKDVGQTAGFPVGKHTIPADVTLSIKLTGKPADGTFGGVLNTDAQAATDCMAETTNPDLGSGTQDMGQADM